MSTVKTIIGSREGNVFILVPQPAASTLAEDDFQSEFRELVGRIHGPEVQAVLVDFGEVEYFGSMILEALRRLATRVSEMNGRMALCNVAPVGLEILRLTRFDTLWPVYDSREEALGVLKVDA